MVRWWGLIVIAGCGFDPNAKPMSAPNADAQVADSMMSTTPPRIVIEAESYTTKRDSPTEAWTSATVLAGYSGASYMQCGPDGGAYCPNDATLSTCAATMTYDVTIATSATYYVHVRTYGASSSSDSLWYGVDGAVATDVVDFVDDAAWNWQTGATTYPLTAGAHTLTIYQRECGAAIDVIGLTPSISNPP